MWSTSSSYSHLFSQVLAPPNQVPTSHNPDMLSLLAPPPGKNSCTQCQHLRKTLPRTPILLYACAPIHHTVYLMCALVHVFFCTCLCTSVTVAHYLSCLISPTLALIRDRDIEPSLLRPLVKGKRGGIYCTVFSFVTQ